MELPSTVTNKRSSKRSNTEEGINGETISCHKNNFVVLETEDKLVSNRK